MKTPLPACATIAVRNYVLLTLSATRYRTTEVSCPPPRPYIVFRFRFFVLLVHLALQLSPDELARARAATIYECLQPPSLTSMRGNRRVASSTSPCGGVGATAGDSRDSPEDDNGEQGQSSLRIHTCWVKAGHDMLHERKPFLLALLDKVIKAENKMQPRRHVEQMFRALS